MDAQEIRNLQEAYMEVVMNEGLGGFKNQGDYEEREREFKRVSDEHLKKYRSGELPFQKQKKADQAQEFLKKHPRKKRTQKEQVDLYDIILSHLLDEGYAETPEAAEVIMVNMGEEWRESIVNEGKSSRPRYPGGRGVLDQETRDEKREASVENMRGHTEGPGTVTKNPKKLRKQAAMGENG
jgi:hypothetical protein